MRKLSQISRDIGRLTPRQVAERWAAGQWDTARTVEHVEPIDGEALAIDFKLRGGSNTYRCAYDSAHDVYVISALDGSRGVSP